MATVVRRTGGRPSPTTKTTARSTKTTTVSKTAQSKIGSSLNLELPTEKSKPIYDLTTTTFFFHGEPGIGKTDFTAQFPDALNLAFEPSGRYLEIFRLPETGSFMSWDQFVRVVDKLVRSDRFRTIVFDTADLAYALCTSHICEEAGEDHINDGELGYGKGVDKVDAEFKKQILRLTATGRGVIFVSHTKAEEFTKGSGVKQQKLIATVKERGRRFINGFVDVTGYYGYFGDERRLVIRGSENVDCKCRIKGRFLTPKGSALFEKRHDMRDVPVSERILSIDMGDSAEESYENFVAAYNNEQTDTGIVRKAELSEVKAAFGSKKTAVRRR